MGAAGYQPNVEQNEAVVWTLKALYGALPCLCNRLGFLVAVFYPISEKKHREIRRLLAKGCDAQPVKDPLS